MSRPLGFGFSTMWKAPFITPPRGSFYADVLASTPTGSTRADGQLLTAWGPASTVVGTPLLATDTVSGGKVIRTKRTDALQAPAGSAAYLAGGPCTLAFVMRYRTTATGNIDTLLDTTEGGTKAGVQVQIGDQVGSIFYGRSISVRVFDGTSWSFDSISAPGAIMSGAFIPLKHQIIVIRLSNTRVDISVDGQSCNVGGWAITRSYIAGTTGKLAIGGAATDYKAIELYDFYMNDLAKIALQSRLAGRFSFYPSLVLQGDPTMTIPLQSASFPYLSRLPNASIYATVYNGIDGPASTDHNDAFISFDGAAWTGPVALTTSAVTKYSDLKTSEPLSDGSLIQVSMTYDGALNFKNVITRRATTFDVQGFPIWGAWSDVLTGTPTWSATQCPPVEDPTNPGTLHMAVFTLESGASFSSVWDYKNTIAGFIAGTPWTRTIMANGVTDSRQYQEPFLWFEGSEIRALIRDGTVNGTTPMRATHSTNGGTSYAASVTVNLPAYSSGQSVRVLLSGRRVWVARQIGSSAKGALFWQAAGAAWNAAWSSNILEIDPLFGGMYYAGIEEKPAGNLIIAMARSAGAGHDNNVAIYQIPEYVLDFTLPGSVSPATSSVTVSTTHQLTITGAGGYTYAVAGSSGGACDVNGVYTGGAANGTDTVTVRDLNNNIVGTSVFTVTGAVVSVTVTSIFPDAGLEGGGTSVTLTGTGFSGASGATVGGVALTSFVVVNGTTITGVTGVHAIGNVNAVVTNGSTGTLTNGFTYIPTGATLLLTGGVGLTLSGSDVQVWADQSGHGNNAAPLSFSPVAATGMNGKPVVRFTNAEALDFASFTSGLTAADVFILAQNADDTSTAAVMAFTSDGQQNFTPLGGSRLCYDGCASTTRQTTGFAPAAGGWSSPWLIEELGTSSEWTFSFNGTQQYTQASNTFGYTTRHIGKGTGNDYIGDIGAVWIWPRKLTTPERVVVVAYLKTRGGIP